MPVIEFAPYAPDMSDLNKSVTSRLANVVPRADGYGPFKAISEFTSALGSACRGFFCANYTDGTIRIFAGTSTDLYLLNNTDLTWTLVSKGGASYSALTSDAHWQFAQFNNFVIAVQQNTVPQVYDISSSGAFADLGGSPPQAGGIAIVGRFVVLFDILNSPYRIQWSGLNATTTWTSGTNYSDYQDFPDGGRVLGVAGGEFGIVMQSQAIRRMVYVPGASIVFDIKRVSKDRGLFARYSVCEAGGNVFLLSTAGFLRLTGDGDPEPIGLEMVDRTVRGDIDQGQLQLCVGAADPESNAVLFVYKSLAGATGLFDKGLVYNWALKKWAPVTVSGEYIAQAATPGLTLEGLDAIAPGVIAISGAANNGSGKVRLTVSSTSGWTTGDIKTISQVVGTTEANTTAAITVIDATHIDLTSVAFVNAYVSGGIVGGSVDAMTLSFDSIATASLPKIGIAGSTHKIGFFAGSALEATLETPETIGTRQRVYINGAQAMTDAASGYVSIGARETLNASLSYSDESAIDSDGYSPLLTDMRSGRIKLRIPAATSWTYASGVEPEIIPAGRF